MKRLSKLAKLNEYLNEFHLGSQPCLDPILVVTGEQATARLHTKSGLQIIIAMPEAKITGNSDVYSESLATAVFVLKPTLGAAATHFSEANLFKDLLDVISELLTKIELDTTRDSAIMGFSLDSCEVTAENSIFGGWQGWSCEVVMS